MKIQLVTFYVVILIFYSSQVLASLPGYYSSENGRMLKLVTPEGSTVYFAEKDLERLPAYRAEILLADLARSVPGGNSNSRDDKNKGERSDLSGYGTIDELLVEANALYNKGKFKDALKFVEEVGRRNPKHFRGLVMKGSLYHVLGFKEQARNSYQKAAEVDPKNTEIKNILRSLK